jgi:hypothetical protein
LEPGHQRSERSCLPNAIAKALNLATGSNLDENDILRDTNKVQGTAQKDLNSAPMMTDPAVTLPKVAELHGAHAKCIRADQVANSASPTTPVLVTQKRYGGGYHALLLLGTHDGGYSYDVYDPQSAITRSYPTNQLNVDISRPMIMVYK